jgi:hypothetical protein
MSRSSLRRIIDAALIALVPIAGLAAGEVTMNAVLVAGDLDGNGRSEIVASLPEEKQLAIFRLEGGRWQRSGVVQLAGVPVAVMINRDMTHPHILVTTTSPNGLVVLTPERDGSYSPWVAQVPMKPAGLTVRRSSDPQMKNAMVVGSDDPSTATISVFETCRTCSCAQRQITVGAHPHRVAPGDVTGDGHEEIIALARGESELVILRRDDDYRIFDVIPTAGRPESLLVRDFDGDGIDDALVGSEQAVSIHFGSSNLPLQRTVRLAVPPGASARAVEASSDASVIVVQIAPARALRFERQKDGSWASKRPIDLPVSTRAFTLLRLDDEWRLIAMTADAILQVD